MSVSKGQFSRQWVDFEVIRRRRELEGKMGSIYRPMDSWLRRKGMDALFRRKTKGKDEIDSQALDQEEAEWTGAREQEKREEGSGPKGQRLGIGRAENRSTKPSREQARRILQDFVLRAKKESGRGSWHGLVCVSRSNRLVWLQNQSHRRNQ
jgi:hypothetical protein